MELGLYWVVAEKVNLKKQKLILKVHIKKQSIIFLAYTVSL